MSVRIIYRDVAVGAAQDAEASATHYDAALSDLSLLPFGAGEALYATLEHNRWLLDGGSKIYSGQKLSFVSDAQSGFDCTFDSDPVITIDFDRQYSSSGITLVFDTQGWCPEVNIKWYQGSTLLDDEDFYPNAAEYFCENTVQSYNKVVITLIKTSMPTWRARVDEIIFGNVARKFERGDLRHVGITQEIDPTSRTLAANALDWTLSSHEDDTEYVFQNRQPVSAFDGTTLLGVFYITDTDRKGDKIFDITCTDAIGLLGDDPFPAAYYNGKNAYDLAVEICDGYLVDMEAALQSKTVTGILKDCTRRTALQQLCFALGAVADTSGTEAIKIFVLPDSDPTVLPTSRIRIGGSVTKAPVVTAIELTAHSYSTSGSGESVEIGGVTYYDTKTVTRIDNPDVTAADKPNVVQVTDATLVSPSNVAEVAQHLYDNCVRRDTHNVKFRIDGETIGDYITTVTPWGDTITGNYVRASLTLSGITVSDAEVIGG